VPQISDIPKEIIQEYKLNELATENRYIYCKIHNGMYCLPQDGIIAQELLQEQLAKVGYHQSKIISGLWTHVMKNASCFVLVFDDFTIKYTNMDNAIHLIYTLKENYTITFDWEVTKYIRLTIK
jgi:hypothetical protein